MTRRSPVPQRKTEAGRGGEEVLASASKYTAPESLKHFIVAAACWGLLPATVADWLVRRLRRGEGAQ